MTTSRMAVRKGIGRRAALRLGLGSVCATGLASRGLAQESQGEGALEEAARAEGEILLYAAPVDNITKRVVDAYNQKFRMRGRFLRLPSNALMQRFSTEAEAGNIVPDLLLTGANPEFIRNAVERKWISPINLAELPVIRDGSFPRRFIRDQYVIAQISPHGVCYNSERVADAEVPSLWTDLLHPRFTGQILIADPLSADAYVDTWATVLDRFGPEFFAKLRAQKPRFFASGLPAVQSLAAGEAKILIPTVASQASVVQQKGAPIRWRVFGYTSGFELAVVFPQIKAVKHPNAARLMANFMLTREGNSLVNKEDGNVSVYDTSGIPAEYVSPNPDNMARRDEIRKLLGII